MEHDVAIIGCGRVGLPLALAFADRGLRTIGVEIDPERLEAVRSGRMPFDEPGAPEVLKRVTAAGTITWSDHVADAARARAHRHHARDAVVLAHRDRHARHPRRARRPAAAAAPRPRADAALDRRARARPSSSPATCASTATSRSARTCSSRTPPSASRPGRFFEEIVSLPCIVGGVGERSGEVVGGAVRGVRRADRADDADPGRAREDLDQHPALRRVRAAEPADDGVRAVRRERLRGHRPHQPRLPARRDEGARASPPARACARTSRSARSARPRRGCCSPSRACTSRCRCSSSRA